MAPAPAIASRALREAIADWLSEVHRHQTHPNTRPRDAATLILIDRSGPTPQVLLGRRHHGHAFMPGKFVFPGGRVEPADYKTAVATPLHTDVERRLMARVQRPSAARARALAVASVRELGEETGLCLGCRSGEKASGEGPWASYADTGLLPDLAKLFFVARVVTPPRRARRFDTRFFAADADAIGHRIDGLVTPDSELVELVWMPLAKAKELDIPNVTKVVLTELEERITAGLRHSQPVPFYRMVNRRFVRELL